MPIIHIVNASPSTPDQKRELMAALTQTYADIMEILPDTIRVILQEVPRDSWSVAGVTLEDSGKDESTNPPPR